MLESASQMEAVEVFGDAVPGPGALTPPGNSPVPRGGRGVVHALLAAEAPGLTSVLPAPLSPSVWPPVTQ